MNEITIDNYLSHDAVVNKFYKGVMSYDELPRVISEGLYVVNTDTSDGPGKHWICLFVDHNHVIDYFDSLGEEPKELKMYLQNQNLMYRYNSKRLQGLMSTVCGNYCILFAFFRARGFGLQYFINLFTNKYTQNDETVVL